MVDEAEFVELGPATVGSAELVRILDLPIGCDLADEEQVDKQVAAPDNQSQNMHVPDSGGAAQIVEEVLALSTI